MPADLTYQAYMAQAPRRIPHYEHWSNPDAETYLSGIDYYEHPRQCRLKLAELYPQLQLDIPASDEPIPRPENNPGNEHEAVRWGDNFSWEWNWGEQFETDEEIFAFSPLEQGDFSNIPVVESHDFRDEEALYRKFRARFPAEWGDQAPAGSATLVGFYNTLFMWPLLTFGYERFMMICLDDRFERLMDEFAELSRRVFRAFARLPVNFVLCHDDIVTTRGPVCSPSWMHKHIFPRYEEYWSMLRDAGKEVIMVVDGCMDAYADDVFACGAQGIITEPYTDFRSLAQRYPDKSLAGEGDNRVLMRNDPAEIEAMVRTMVETAQRCNGYLMCIGNHIPWNVPPDAVKRYLDLSAELAVRD